METEQRQKQRGHRQQKVGGGESTTAPNYDFGAQGWERRVFVFVFCFFLQAPSHLKEKSSGDVKEFQERKPSEGTTRDSHRRRQRLGRRGLLTKERAGAAAPTESHAVPT